MKQIITFITFVCLSVAALTGCSSNTKNENTTIGGVTGAVVGGVAGSFFGGGTGKILAVGVGAIAGALVGGVIGNSMDSTDCTNMNHAMNAPTHKHTHWNNKRTHAQYTMTPTSNMTTMNGNAYCRTFETTATINGSQHQTQGTACRQADGTWKAVNA